MTAWYKARLGVLAAMLGLGLSGCNMETAVNDDGGGDGESQAKRVYESPGGTSDIGFSTADNGVSTLSSFDPGAFVRSTNAGEASSTDGLIDPAQSEPPPPPPPGDGGSPPPPPPPDNGGNPPPPPPGDNPPPPDNNPPPPDGQGPPPDGANGPPPQDPNAPPPENGQFQPEDPNNPPPDGEFPPPDPNDPNQGEFPPDGEFPPFDPNNPPDGFPPFDPNNPPPDGFPPFDPNNPPPDGFPPFDPNFPPDGGFPPFDPNNPPPDGEFFPPPPPPPGFEDFPDDFFFFDDFENFLPPPPPGGEFPPGEPPPPPTFEDFPFEQFLQEHSIEEFIPDIPPPFIPDQFGAFDFGDVPPPPPGFPPFPPPPPIFFEGGTEFGSFFDGPGFPPPPPLGPNGEPLGPPIGPDGGPIGPPPDLPPEFFAFNDVIAGFDQFLLDFPPIPPDGPFPPDGGPFPPDGGPFSPDGPFPPDGLPFPPDLGALPFDDIRDLLPEDFLPPDLALQEFEDFGADHPLIGDGAKVNPELEVAAFDRPPLPPGFDGFDFDGDCPQFDDLFTVFDEEMVGQTMRGQVNATFTETLEDGTEVRCSETSVVESVLGPATPLVEMEDGVFQTQWVVNIRQLTSSQFQFGDETNPESFDQTRERLSQMTWTMVMNEVDTTGDGEPNEMRVSGSNKIDILSENFEGTPPEGLPPLPPPPELLLPFDFQGVLDFNEGQAPADGTSEDPTSNDGAASDGTQGP